MKYRRHLPQLDGGLFLTDGGMETTFIFHDGMDLPEFASFPLLDTEEGREALHRYFSRYAALARERGVGFVIESPTWRANRDWGARLGYSAADLDRVNRAAIALMEEVRAEYEADEPFVISGCIGPQSDGYQPAEHLSAEAAEDYHGAQIATFADTAADMVSAFTLTYVDEAIGIVRAAAAAGLPSVISFTVETDGRLPSGQALGAAIEQVDAETASAAAYFMVNCAHPAHFLHVLDDGGGARTCARCAGERVQEEPRGARRGGRARRRRSRRLRCRLRRAASADAARQRARRLLRHRLPPRRRGRRRLGIAARGLAPSALAAVVGRRSSGGRSMRTSEVRPGSRAV